jgi:hypothetical protein
MEISSTQQSALDLEATPVPGQLASAVLTLHGEIIRGQLASNDAALLFQMLMEVGAQESQETDRNHSFRRLTVTFSKVRYVVVRDDSHVYMVQTRVAG